MILYVFRRNNLSKRHILLLFVIFGIVYFFKTIKITIIGHIKDDDSKVAPKFSHSAVLRESQDYDKLNNNIQSINNEEKILNSDIFGTLSADTIILVILLDRLSIGFRFLMRSLSEVTGIEEALIIFSHSYYDEEINNLVRGIDFCRVLQIYYPYSIQTHPNEFPGYNPSDCLHDLRSDLAGRINCTGALFPDLRGHFRNPPYAQKKHHWWWTANTIFERLTCTEGHTGLVIFLEDNFIFMKDFVYMASYMKSIADSLPQCEFLSLGSDTIPEKIELRNFYGVRQAVWEPKLYSRVLGFDISTWNSIVSHYDFFCTVDDTSWLRTLYYISMHRRDGPRFQTLSAVTPRAYKIDSCSYNAFWFSGFRQCDLSQNVLQVLNLEKLNERECFPPFLELYMQIELEEDDDLFFDYSDSNGGWADPRDWALCRNMTAGKAKKIIMEMNTVFDVN